METGGAGLKQCPTAQIHLSQIMKNPQNPNLALLPRKKIPVKPAGNVCTPSVWTAEIRTRRTWHWEKLLRAWCRDQAIATAVLVCLYVYIYMFIYIHTHTHTLIKKKIKPGWRVWHSLL